MAFTITATDVFHLKTLYLTEFPLQESLVMSAVVKLAQPEMVKYI